MKTYIYNYINDDFKSLEEFFKFYKISKRNIYLLLENNSVKINNQEIKKADCSLNKGDKITINQEIIKVNSYLPWQHEIKILYEDEDIIIIYKEANLLIHPDGNTNETLVNALSYYFKNCDIIFEHVHRLDFETCGIVLFSKNIFAHTYLVNLFEERGVKKEYVCICHGIFKNKQGEIKRKIGRNRHNNLMCISESGKEAYTKYQVLDTFDNKTRLNVEIEGGRKHQIRLHLASINHPILGDKLYGINDNNERLLLEFYHIEFIHPRTKKKFDYSIKWEF